MESDSDNEEMMMSQKHDAQKLEDIINELEVKKINFINQLQYLEAEKIQTQIEKLQKKKEHKDRKELELLHFNELKSLEEAFTTEMEAVTEEYSKKFLELEKMSKTWEEELEKKQKQEMADLTKQISDQVTNKFKCNKEYMNLVKQEELLVKSLKLKEAHVVKIKREKILKQNEEESKKLDKSPKPTKNRLQFDKIEKKHQHDKEILKAKIEREIEKIKKEKTMTLEQLHHKYKNRKLNLENNYKKEINLTTNPVRAKSSNYKIPKLKTTSNVFPKLSNIDNYSVHNTMNSRHNTSNKNLSFQPEKINVNLKNVQKQNNNTNNSKNNENNSPNDEYNDMNNEDNTYIQEDSIKKIENVDENMKQKENMESNNQISEENRINTFKNTEGNKRNVVTNENKNFQ